jgi:hypothetical protein
MINRETHSIPQLWSDLPFIEQARFRPIQEHAWLEVSNLQILLQRILIGHIQNALCDLFGRSRFATPLWPLYENCTLAFKFLRQNCVRDSFSIICHSRANYTKINRVPSSVRRFGAFLFGVLARFCSAFWRYALPQQSRNGHYPANKRNKRHSSALNIARQEFLDFAFLHHILLLLFSNH